jgi:hypothetical protein
MCANFKVKIPDDKTGISRKKIKGVTYIYFAYGREYNPDKKYTVPKCTSIGKCAEDEPDMMYPNNNFLKYFPGADIQEEEQEEAYRSGCLHIGTYLVLRRIITEYHLDEILGDIIGRDLVKELVLSVKGTFEESREHSIRRENGSNYMTENDWFLEKIVR